MLLGSADQVRAETRRVVEGLGRVGHILGTSNSILPGTPPENVLAMVEEARRHTGVTRAPTQDHHEQ